MSDDVQVEPWPAWVRYPLFAVFAIVVFIGIVLGLRNGVDSAVVRILIAAVVIPALLAPVLVWRSRRR